MSDEHKEKIRATAEAGRYKAGEQTIAPGDIVWLQYRNREHARRLMKAGGQPWKHPYRVEALSNSGAKLIPIKGSPLVMHWQPIHRLTKSPPRFHDELPLYELDSTGLSLAPFYETPELREHLAANPLDGHVKEGAPNPDGTYSIERIVSAKWDKAVNDYMIKIKWKGYTEPTGETRTFLLNPDNCSDEDIHRQVRDAIRRARRSNGVSLNNEHSDEEITDDSDEELEDTEGAMDEVDGGTNQLMLLSASDEMFDLCEFFRSKLLILRSTL